MASLGLRMPHSRRLQSGRDFQAVRAGGRRVAHGFLVLNWMTLPSASCSRLGIVVGRKIGKANVRNRARRLLRESFRLHQHQLAKPVDLVLVARPSIAGKRFVEVEAHFLGALKRVGLLKEAS